MLKSRDINLFQENPTEYIRENETDNIFETMFLPKQEALTLLV